jgi:dTDP-4-dehydrorhamnose reductase
MNILVTGGNGQLANNIKEIVKEHNDIFTFVSRRDFDITDEESVNAYFSEHDIDVVINCAAYTKVDLAEDERIIAFDVNVNAVKYLAKASEGCGAELYHLSTDFVFDGESRIPYREVDACNPLSVYGKTKYEGEMTALKYCSKTQIIRASWLYSVFGNNFVKTIVRLASERDGLSIVADQIGTPTNAENLAKTILIMIASDKKYYGEIYHFSDEGDCSWYDFASEIIRLKGIDCTIKPIPSEAYPQKALRPEYSVMSKDKIIRDYGIELVDWKIALESRIKGM